VEAFLFWCCVGAVWLKPHLHLPTKIKSTLQKGTRHPNHAENHVVIFLSVFLFDKPFDFWWRYATKNRKG